jgi:hypothetical protein
MPLTLYAATVPSFLQIIGATGKLLDKAELLCAEKGMTHVDVIQARLADDMLPFAYQVKSVAVHSAGAIEGVRRGEFAPDTSTPPDSFDGLRLQLVQAKSLLEAVDPEEMEALQGRAMVFAFGKHRIDFTVENFLLSFSQPNFYFHAATAYDILRWLGAPVGKADFMGRQRRGLS